jgi:acetyl esterase/lipase
VPLWPAGSVPHALSTGYEDTPELLVYTPARVRTTTGVLILPGGGYSGFSLATEGIEIAQFLNAAGIPAFVLRYRLGIRYQHPVQLEDAQRAMRMLRANATLQTRKARRLRPLSRRPSRLHARHLPQRWLTHRCRPHRPPQRST